MARRFRAVLGALATVVAVEWLAPGPLVGQAPSGGAREAAPADNWTAPRTPWGDADLQGIWTYGTITPLERPQALAEREFLTEEEVAAANEKAQSRPDRGKSTGRTSLIIDPSSGRLPPLTPEGQKRQAERAEYRRAHPADSWEDRPLQERCITYHGVPPLPSRVNNNYQIFQIPGYVVILDENIHDVRVIPLDGRPHLPQHIRQWNGDSRGRWEGTTLVVETTNYSPKTTFRFPVAGQTLGAVERFTRIAADEIDYQFTIDDPATYTRPWTVKLPMLRLDGRIYEYACHEGNYSIANVLRGARAQEKASEEAAKTRR